MANKKDLLAQCKALGINTEGLGTNANLEAAITAYQLEKTSSSEGDNTQEPTTETQKSDAAKEAKALKQHQSKNPSVFVNPNGAKYRFKKSAPKMLRVDGVGRYIKDLINDKEIMLELISGNNNFVERIN